MTIYRQTRHEPHSALFAAPSERVYDLIRASTITSSPMRYVDLAEALNVTRNSLDCSLKVLMAAGRIQRVRRGCYASVTAARKMPPPPVDSDLPFRPISLSQLMAGR